MKTILLTLLLSCLGVWAQAPASTTPNTTNSPARWDTVPEDARFSPLPPEAPPASPAAPKLNSSVPAVRPAIQAATNAAPAVAPTASAPSAVPTLAPAATVLPVAPVPPPLVDGNASRRSATAVPSIIITPSAPPAQPVVSPAAQPPISVSPAPSSVTPVAQPVQPVVPPAAPPTVTAPPSASGALGLPAVSPATVPGGPGMIAIAPPAGATNSSMDQVIKAGMIDFRGVNLDQVLKLYAEWVNRTILRSTSLPSPIITLTTQTDLTTREAIQAIDAVLGLNGIAMINMGDKFVKAVPVAEAGAAGQVFSKVPADQLPDMGQYVTHVVQLKYIPKPSEIVPALQPFARLPTAILPIDATQILVLRDYTENVKRMLEMINQLDVAIPAEFTNRVIPIKYALASDIASALNSLSTGGGGASIGTSRSTGTRSTTTTRPGYGTTGSTMPGASPFGQQPGVQPGAAAAAPAVGSSFTDRLKSIISKASVSGEIVVLGQTKIIADERTNSLLVYASRDDMKTIEDIVSKLDVVLAQVLIEAVIIEVDLGPDTTTLGFSYLLPPGNINNGAVNNGQLLPQPPPMGSIYNLNGNTGGSNGVAGAIPSGFSYLFTGANLEASVTAIASKAKARILQRPRIQTSQAKAASIFVGSSVPYPTSSYYGGAAYGGYSSIQQVQIGTTLEVTPLINPDGLVVMDIHTKIDSVTGSSTIANVGQVPITSDKDAVSTVAVHDRDTIILGGLIETSKSESHSGVPVLMDIPLLGYLFRSSTSGPNSRQELIVMIRPTVLPTPEVAALQAKAEKNKMPGVRQAETEEQHDEDKLMRATEKELRNPQ